MLRTEKTTPLWNGAALAAASWRLWLGTSLCALGQPLVEGWLGGTVLLGVTAPRNGEWPHPGSRGPLGGWVALGGVVCF